MAETKLCGYIDLNRLCPSAVVVLLFTSIHMAYLMPGGVTSTLYYVMILLGIIVLLGIRRNLGFRMIAIWATGAAVLSLLNTLIIGNQNIIRTGILVAAFFIAALFLSDEVDERAFAISSYLNSLFVLVRVLQNGGTRERVYDGYSNNYVSVLLLSPAVLYYAVCSARNKKCSIWPAVCVWGLSFVMAGRGGVLSTSFLLLGVLLHKFFLDEASRRDRVILGIILCMILIPAVIYGLSSLFQSDSNLYIVDRINKNGLDGGQRLDIWNEYITDMFKSWQYLFFGVKQDIIVYAQQFSGNLHNSFLFVHAYLGIIGFVVFVGLVIRAFWKSIQSGKWLYFCALFTFAFRGFTDHVFGSNRISAIMIALVLLPDFIDLFATKKNGERIQNQF